MTRPVILFIFLLEIAVTGYGQTYKSDTSVIAILPHDTSRHWLFKDGKPAGLTPEDLLQVEEVLQKCIGGYNAEQEKLFEKFSKEHSGYSLDKRLFVIDLPGYKRQYVAVFNSKGEKEVWVNCFCDALDIDWKKHQVFVFDGGNCYFNLKINLATGEFYDLMVNGDA